MFVGAEGQPLEPHVTKTGRKVAPKVEGVKRRINPDFFDAYFKPFETEDDGVVVTKLLPVVDNWVGKEILADIELEHDEQYGSKNVVKRFKKAE